LIVYYLLAFLGEQLARTGKISVVEGSFIPIVVSVFAIAWFSLSFKLNLSTDRFSWVGSRLRPKEQSILPRLRRNLFIDVTTGLRDFDLIVNLAKYYFLTLGFLAAVFVIFTAFELWKFAGIIDGGVRLLINYLLFLLPFVYIQLAPSAAMIAVLATYVIKSRQNEIVTWTSAGQSVYRILVPCMVFMAALGIINWQIQERLAPKTNQTQDELRTQLRSRGVTANQSGKYWVANDARIYSFEIDKSASDNETRYSSPCSTTCGVKNLTIYEFESVGHHLQTLYRVPSADWGDDKIVFAGEIQRIDLKEGRFEVHTQNGGELAEASNPFGEIRKKPSHLTTSETREQLRNSDSEIEQRSFGVALQKKYSTIILPLIIAAFTAPFALSLSRKGKAVTVGYAVGLWLLFMGTTSAFDQLGLNGNLSPVLAVWAPLVLFAMLGTYLLSRVKT
jgi:lipopolysaccharide export system permease protein